MPNTPKAPVYGYNTRTKVTKDTNTDREDEMKESDIEKYLVGRVKAAGGMAYKFVSPGRSGVPDRMVCFPGGRILFVELKAPGRKPTPLQTRRHEELRDLGFSVWVIASMEAVDEFIEWEA